MSAYSDNHAVNDTVLTVINDGRGEQCGATYQDRVSAARRGDRYAFRTMARQYGRHRKVYGSRNLTHAEWIEAGDILADYYAEHIKEIDG